MILYLLKCIPSDKYILELYGNNALRCGYTNWQNSESEAISAPLQQTWSKTVTVDERITTFNDGRKHLDGATLAIISTYTPETHPEMFI